MRETIGILFVGYTHDDEISEAVIQVAKQNVAAKLELVVCDPKHLLDHKKLSQLSISWPVKISSDENDELGLLETSAEYIAICAAGEMWCSVNKLMRQLEVLQSDPSCSLVVHDVELLKENGYPVDQDLRNNFIRNVGFEERKYEIAQLQKFESCGIFGTWMFRNIFLNAEEREKYQNSKLGCRLRLLSMLIANGYCVNLLDDRFVSLRPDEEKLQRTVFPKYDMDTVRNLRKELAEFQSFLEDGYGISVDTRYRLLHIAIGALSYLAENEAMEEAVNMFLALFQECDCPEYDGESLESAEQNLFIFLRNKLWQYVAEKGTEAAISLIACLDGSAPEQWADGINRCKNAAVKSALVSRFESNCDDAKALIAADRRGKNVFIVYPAKVFQKAKKLLLRAGGLFKKLVVRHFRKQGYSDYMANEWYETVKSNLLGDKETPLKQKLWCYRRGFMPWRITQYDMTEDNFREYLSDRDYMYLHQINNSYKKWIEDKMTLRLVLEPFKKHIPEYYYQIIQRDDKQLILRLADCPSGYEASFDELFRLLREKGKLAFKAASGTHGIGFYKVEYADGKYYLNTKEVSETDIRNVINSFGAFYIVTEYVNMHDDIKNIFAGSVNTIRVMMINRDGHHPQLMDAYMRIGSGKSGVTDNVAYGGVVCSINMETGEYGNGLQLVNHVYIPIENHPDTGTPLHGVIPNWETIKAGLIDISKYLSQLEYLGFDVVCTPEDFVVLEINSHQDLHRLPCYDQRVRDFYFYKLRRKERQFKIKRNY